MIQATPSPGLATTSCTPAFGGPKQKKPKKHTPPKHDVEGQASISMRPVLGFTRSLTACHLLVPRSSCAPAAAHPARSGMLGLNVSRGHRTWVERERDRCGVWRRRVPDRRERQRTAGEHREVGGQEPCGRERGVRGGLGKPRSGIGHEKPTKSQRARISREWKPYRVDCRG